MEMDKMKETLVFLGSLLTLWPSLFALSLTIFRQNTRNYFNQILLSSLVMAYVTYWTQTYHLGLGIAFVQPVSVLLCFWLIFKIRFVHALIVFTQSYIYGFVVEILFYVLISHIKNIPFIPLARDSFFMPMIIITIFNILAILFLRHFRIGFSFVQFRKNKYINPEIIRIVPRIIYYCLGLTFISLISIYFLQSKITLVTSISCSLMVYFYYVYFLYNKEMSDD
ncbi:hypothetical protein ACVNS2_09755 [Paenibacillus caseinilyticus]|nr:hypothetical protein [Paenibacillus mucilaginosus]